jgi:hypothetical protein
VRNGLSVCSAGHEPLVGKHPALSGLEELRSLAQPLRGAAPRATATPTPVWNAISGMVQAEPARPPNGPGKARSKHGYRDSAFASLRGRSTRMGDVGIPQSRITPGRGIARRASCRVAIPEPAGTAALPRQGCASFGSQALGAKGACEQDICWHTA